MWKLRYYRHYSLEEYTANTKDEAISFGVVGEDNGDLSMYELISPEGEIVMDSKQLGEYYENYEGIDN